jgi:hypothetical protein
MAIPRAGAQKTASLTLDVHIKSRPDENNNLLKQIINLQAPGVTTLGHY